MKVKVLLGTATIALVAYSGAVYATLGQEMPDSAPEPVYSAVEIVEESTAEIQSQEIAEAQVTKPIVIALEPEPIDTRPEWRKYLDTQAIEGANYAQSVECILNWDKYMAPVRAHLMSPVASFAQQTDAYKNDNIVSFFNEVNSGVPPCFQSGTLL